MKAEISRTQNQKRGDNNQHALDDRGEVLGLVVAVRVFCVRRHGTPADREERDYGGSHIDDALDGVRQQRYAAGQHEAGIFYFRFPGKGRGQIFSITEKIFPTITGDGVRTVEELIRADSRAALIARTYLRRFAHRRNEILSVGEVLKLVETGNHAQGCIFRDGGHLRTDALERVIENISRKVPGFYIGRYDIRYENEEDFKQGRNFQIVELNGATSEATNIYDARNSLISAYRTLFRQWKLVFAIGAANRARGCRPSPLRTLWREWRQYSAAAVSYPCAS